MHQKLQFSLSLILLFALVFLVACEPTDGPKSDKFQISVSIVPQKTFVEAVVKDKADINVVIPPGSSPATYEPTPEEAVKFNDADLYFAIGVPSEQAYILPLINTAGLRLVMLHTLVSADYPDIMLASDKRDPHIWLSVNRVIRMVEVIAHEMSLLDPDHTTFYQDNADAYIAALNTLKDDALIRLANLENRAFIVFHPAFRYLADDFNLQMYALEEDGKEATAQQIADMIDFAKSEGIKVIFYQAEFSSVQAQAFAEEIGGQTMMLAPLSPDYINNLKAMIDLLYDVLSANES